MAFDLTLLNAILFDQIFPAPPRIDEEGSGKKAGQSGSFAFLFSFEIVRIW